MVKKTGIASAKRVPSAGGMNRSQSQKWRVKYRDQDIQSAPSLQGPGTRAPQWGRRHKTTPEPAVQDQRPPLQAPGSASAAAPPWSIQAQAGDDLRFKRPPHSRSSSQSSTQPKSMVSSSSNGSLPPAQRQQKKDSKGAAQHAHHSRDTVHGVRKESQIPRSRGSSSDKDQRGVPYRPAYPSSTPAGPAFPELAASLFKSKKDTAKKGPRGNKSGKSKRKESIGKQRREGDERASSSQPGTRVGRATLTPNQSRTATSASDSDGSSSQSSRASIRTLESTKVKPHYSWETKDDTGKNREDVAKAAADRREEVRRQQVPGKQCDMPPPSRIPQKRASSRQGAGTPAGRKPKQDSSDSSEDSTHSAGGRGRDRTVFLEPLSRQRQTPPPSPGTPQTQRKEHDESEEEHTLNPLYEEALNKSGHTTPIE